MESDCLQVVEACGSRSPSHEIAMVVEDIMAMKEWSQIVLLLWCPQEANQAVMGAVLCSALYPAIDYTNLLSGFLVRSWSCFWFSYFVTARGLFGLKLYVFSHVVVGPSRVLKVAFPTKNNKNNNNNKKSAEQKFTTQKIEGFVGRVQLCASPNKSIILWQLHLVDFNYLLYQNLQYYYSNSLFD